MVYSSSIRCSSCGLTATGYLQVTAEGKGITVCPRCGTRIVADVPPGAVIQVPPVSYAHPVQAHVPRNHYPGLYMQPKHAPRYALEAILKVPFSPTKALTNLYLSTSLNHVLVVVAVFAFFSTMFGVIITEDMASVLGYTAADTLEIVAGGVFSWIVSILSFLVFGLVAAIVSHEVFGGRGDKSSTITLVGCCYPWFVLLTIILLSIFAVGFQGLDLSTVQDWSNSEMTRAIMWGSFLLLVAVLGFIWMLVVVSRAISIANDTSLGGGAMAAVLAAIAAGIISLVVDSLVRLPIGLTF